MCPTLIIAFCRIDNVIRHQWSHQQLNLHDNAVFAGITISLYSTVIVGGHCSQVHGDGMGMEKIYWGMGLIFTTVSLFALEVLDPISQYGVRGRFTDQRTAIEQSTTIIVTVVVVVHHDDVPRIQVTNITT